jgi:hypothetical protein
VPVSSPPLPSRNEKVIGRGYEAPGQHELCFQIALSDRLQLQDDPTSLLLLHPTSSIPWRIAKAPSRKPAACAARTNSTPQLPIASSPGPQ